MKWIIALILALPLACFAQGGSIKMEKVTYGGWKDCIRLTRGELELIATTEVGPRIIRFGFTGGQNMFGEMDGDRGQTGGESWRLYGGHRLWHAPEHPKRTYSPDNSPVPYQWSEAKNTLTLSQPVEPETGIQKEISITFEPEGSVLVTHRLTNTNLWAVELAPWSLSVMAKSGRAIIPQEDPRPHPDSLLPVRPVVLWAYTDMQDPRWTWGTKYIQLTQDPNAKSSQKAGIANTKGWAAYALKGDLFVKRYAYQTGAAYPDFGSNTELYTDANILEVETLGPMSSLPPQGFVIHQERWYLFKASVGRTEAEIDSAVLPLIAKTKGF